jgi:hypothetical protein
LQITSCLRSLVQQEWQVLLVPAQQQADRLQEPPQVQQARQARQEQEQPGPMRFQQFFRRMQLKRGSTELQSEQNDS